MTERQRRAVVAAVEEREIIRGQNESERNKVALKTVVMEEFLTTHMSDNR